MISAPGKLVLAGEYAVLEGYPGLAMAVNRRVFLESSPNTHRSKLWDAVSAGVKAKANFEIDSSELYVGAQKMGLGSSAAVAVCMAAFVDPENAYERALEGHRAFFKGSGSGIDVATCYQGGLIRFQNGRPESLWPNIDESMVMTVFTGASKETASFLAKVDLFKKSAPESYEQLMKDLGGLTNAWQQFYTGFLGWSELASLVTENRKLHLELGKRAKIQLLSSEHQAIWAICRQFGAYSKPSGAGGGDIALCFVPPDMRSSLEQALHDAGFKPLALKYFEPGLSVDNRAMIS